MRGKLISTRSCSKNTTIISFLMNIGQKKLLSTLGEILPYQLSVVRLLPTVDDSFLPPVDKILFDRVSIKYLLLTDILQINIFFDSELHFPY